MFRVSRGASNDGRAAASERGDATGGELGDEAAAAVAVNVSAQTASAPRARFKTLPPPEAPELVAQKVERRHEHDGDRLGGDLANVDIHEQPQDPDVCAERD